MASMGDMGARFGMLVVETIGKIRRAHFVQKKKKPIKVICRELGLSRKVVRKVLRSEATEFRYARSKQTQPKLGPWRADLDRLLAENEAKQARERLTRSGATPRPGARWITVRPHGPGTEGQRVLIQPAADGAYRVKNLGIM